ncbi:MAG: glycoside hydrolase family 2 TIM barrel-domain containing protein [Bacteroidota bacterium]
MRIPAATTYRGEITFQRNLNMTRELLDRYQFHLVMLGVNYSADISVNGEFVANHAGGFTSFAASLPENALQAGDANIIRIAVNTELTPTTTLPPRASVWGMKNYGGVYREVFLLGTPRFYVRDAVIRSDLAANGMSARVTGYIIVEGKDSLTDDGSSGTGAVMEVVDRISGVTVATSAVVPLVRKGGEWEEARTEVLLFNPKVWSPEAPDLYLVRCKLVRAAGKEIQLVDEYDVATGVRSVAVAGGNILLNGKRLVLKGVTWYEDHPSWGSAIPAAERERDVVLMKNLGANAVRFVGHPPHPTMLDLCDRYGLLALEEIPVTQTPGALLATEHFADLASTALQEMIVRDRNHPSVLAWGLGDEFETTHPAARPFVEMLVQRARLLDQRPLYFCTTAGNSSCDDLVDFAAVDVREQDVKAFRTRLDAWRGAHRKQPLVVARFGTEVQQENRNGYSDPLSQEAQARFFLQRLDVLRTLDYDGAIVWSFNDWLGDRPALTVHSGDPYLHSVGLVSAAREKRLAYDAVRSVFRGEKFVAMPMGTYSSGAPIIYVLSGFVVLIAVAYVYNASRRFRESLHRSLLNSYNFFADVRDQRIVTVGLSTLLGVMVSFALAIVASSLLYHFRDSLVLDNLLSYLLVSDRLKAWAVHMIWSPLRCIVISAGLVFVTMVLAAGFVHLLKLFVRARIFPFHAYTVTMWATAPLLVLVPVGMILYRVLESSVYVIPAFALVAILVLWVFLRLLKGVAIVFDILPFKVYLLGVLAVAVVGGAAYAYFDYAQAAPIYVSFLLSTLAQ